MNGLLARVAASAAAEFTHGTCRHCDRTLRIITREEPALGKDLLPLVRVTWTCPADTCPPPPAPVTGPEPAR